MWNVYHEKNVVYTLWIFKYFCVEHHWSNMDCRNAHLAQKIGNVNSIISPAEKIKAKKKVKWRYLRTLKCNGRKQRKRCNKHDYGALYYYKQSKNIPTCHAHTFLGRVILVWEFPLDLILTNNTNCGILIVCYIIHIYMLLLQINGTRSGAS